MIIRLECVKWSIDWVYARKVCIPVLIDTELIDSGKVSRRHKYEFQLNQKVRSIFSCVTTPCLFSLMSISLSFSALRARRAWNARRNRENNENGARPLEWKCNVRQTRHFRSIFLSSRKGRSISDLWKAMVRKQLLRMCRLANHVWCWSYVARPLPIWTENVRPVELLLPSSCKWSNLRVNQKIIIWVESSRINTLGRKPGLELCGQKFFPHYRSSSKRISNSSPFTYEIEINGACLRP